MYLKIVYTKQAKQQLYDIRDYIAKDSIATAIKYLSKIKYKQIDFDENSIEAI